ncbi:protein DGS1, mitochondrial-like [Lycium barbarum]|uniref:protein DGS1, mitochondrial-like n=1 Tax=Lycium barbarum TaxID=112863 RepID=UPI00293E52D6|nr:protein DGS1, mitochondrial-like [Lycium barbarum]
MVCERGPYAFINGTVQLICDCVGDGSGVEHTYCMASSYISESIIVLSSLRYHLATFLAQFRYEKELMHPIQNLLSGELARALLIQVQKLKLNIEEAMLELDQILRAVIRLGLLLLLLL